MASTEPVEIWYWGKIMGMMKTLLLWIPTYIHVTGSILLCLNVIQNYYKLLTYAYMHMIATFPCGSAFHLCLVNILLDIVLYYNLIEHQPHCFL